MEVMTDYQRKKRVDELLIEPLIKTGMRKQARFKLEDHERFLDRLRGRLAYLDADNLKVLVPVLESAAGGKHKNTWPDLVSITNWAHGLQKPPDGDSRLITSYMKSEAGKQAWKLGPEYALMLRKHLRTYQRPPIEYSWIKIRQDATDLIGRATVIKERMTRGTASDEAQSWLAGLERALKDVEGFVFPKIESAEHEQA
ncbi:MAG: hypothetical protein COA84_15160 [Robiginitomaculum sp.]|nr:MAG: hypothetical protein COA84_15160 [Robiginitomaculum sp.]